MSKIEVTKVELKDGVWRGIVTTRAKAPPQIEITHDGAALPCMMIRENAEDTFWTLRVPIPSSAISDGVQTLLIRDAASDDILGHISMMADDPLAKDLHAEVSLLRAELDLLKRAFRRHASDTGTGTSDKG
jgi:hypothetical protein